MRRAGSLVGVLIVLTAASGAQAQSPLQVDHTPPPCLTAEKPSLLVACLTPRTARADVRVLFRADEGAWYAAPMRYEMPCYRAVLPRTTAGTPRVTYVVEALRGGVTARSAEHAVPVQEACTAPSPVAGQRVSWEAPAGAPKPPPGFEGARLRDATTQRAADAPPAARAAPTPRAAPRSPAPPAPVPAVKPPASPPPAAEAKGGHGFRNAVIVLGGAAAAGGAAVAVRSSGGDAAPPTTTGTGLPAGGVAGTYVGTESVVYSSTCTGTDDVVLNLQESGSVVSGALTFTVRTCSCCASGRGATPISGFLTATRIDFSTPIGFGYSGTFAGNHLAGSLSGPGGVSGSWMVDKR